jgi:hypothetical protein
MSLFKVVYRRHRALGELNLSLLLFIEVLAIFIVGPLVGSHMLRPWLFDACLLAIGLLSINGIAKTRYTRLLILLGMVGMIVASGFDEQQSREQIICRMFFFAIFVSAITCVVARTVYNEGPVTWHRIRGAMIIYLNVALLFAMAGNVLSLFIPDAYSNIADDGKNHLSQMIYFSVTTLTTTGFGDFVPVHPLARSLANFEEIVGQLYPATLLATLIGRHVSWKAGDG